MDPTEAQQQTVAELRRRYGTATISEQYADGGLRVIARDPDDRTHDFEVEVDGAYARTRTT